VSVKTFKYRTNLARKMSAPGGRSVSDVLTAAEGALDGHRTAAMQTLRSLLAELEATCAARRESEVYAQAAALLDMAGFFETGPLHPAIFSLCEISDWMGAGSSWEWPSVDVHLRAIQMILKDDCRDTQETRLILEGLVAIRQRVRQRL
jgi:hypothetical protein